MIIVRPKCFSWRSRQEWPSIGENTVFYVFIFGKGKHQKLYDKSKCSMKFGICCFIFPLFHGLLINLLSKCMKNDFLLEFEPYYLLKATNYYY
jgi:hypothetical protein